MKENEYPQKHPRGSSPHEELQKEVDDWVRGLRSMEPDAEDPIPTKHVGARGKRKTAIVAREPGPPRQSDDEGRWQDDGGDCG